MGHIWAERTTYGGKAVNWGTRYLIEAANKILADPANGGEKGPLTIIQGSWSGASASAGTHTGAAALDITPFNWRNRERVFRLLGTAMWHRPAMQNVWVEHIHGIVDGDGDAASVALNQVKSYHQHRNGLANNGPDQGYRMLVFPLFVFPEKPQGKPGPCTVTKEGKSYEQPTTLSTAKKAYILGQTFDVIAVVNVGGAYWGINAAAECFPMENLARSVEPTPIPEPVPVPTVTEFEVSNWNSASPRWFKPWAPRKEGFSREIKGEASVHAFQEVYENSRALDIHAALGLHFYRVWGHAGLEFFFDRNLWELERPVYQGGYASGIQGRYALVVHMRRKETGKHVAFIVGHAPALRPDLRAKYGAWLARLIADVDGPIVILGDWNTSKNYLSPRKNIRALGYRDMREQASILNEKDRYGEFPGKKVWLGDIFTKPSEAKILTGQLDLTSPDLSDHRRIEVKVRLQK